jgi:hypothetical protein
VRILKGLLGEWAPGENFPDKAGVDRRKSLILREMEDSGRGA